MTESHLPHLLPCPFCGSVQIAVAGAREGEVGEHRQPITAAGCQSCGATGPTVTVPQGSTGYAVAAHGWNSRAAGALSDDPRNPWRPLTGPGQVRPRDWLCFILGNRLICARARQILNPGSAREEIIYNLQQNHYFITSMAVDGTSSHKGVLVASHQHVARRDKEDVTNG